MRTTRPSLVSEGLVLWSAFAGRRIYSYRLDVGHYNKIWPTKTGQTPCKGNSNGQRPSLSLTPFRFQAIFLVILLVAPVWTREHRLVVLDILPHPPPPLQSAKFTSHNTPVGRRVTTSCHCLPEQNTCFAFIFVEFLIFIYNLGKMLSNFKIPFFDEI